MEMRLEAEQPLACWRTRLPSMRQDGWPHAGLRGFRQQLGPAPDGLEQQQVVQGVAAERECRLGQPELLWMNADVQNRARDLRRTGGLERRPEAQRFERRDQFGREKLTTDLVPGKPRLLVKRNGAALA